MKVLYAILIVATGFSYGSCCFGDQGVAVDEDEYYDDYEDEAVATTRLATTIEAITLPPKSEDPDDQELRYKAERMLIAQIPCQFATCSFEGGTLCLFESFGIPGLPLKLGNKVAQMPAFEEFMRGQGPLPIVREKGTKTPNRFNVRRRQRQRAQRYRNAARAHRRRNRRQTDRRNAYDYDYNYGGTDGGPDAGPDVGPDAGPDVGPNRGPDPDDYATSDADRSGNVAWLAWSGRFGNRITGISEPAWGNWYAAVYLMPGESAVMEAENLSPDNETTIQFYAWEASAATQMRMCCDKAEDCQVESPYEGWPGHRIWHPQEVKCPAGTKRFVFVCVNNSKGQIQGACGLDAVAPKGERCPSLQGRHETPQALLEIQL